MERLGLLLAVGSLIVQLCSGQEAFLAKSLPLTVLVTTPSEVASDAAKAVTLTGRQAITVSTFHTCCSSCVPAALLQGSVPYPQAAGCKSAAHSCPQHH